MKLLKRLLILMILALAVPTAFAQRTGTLEGSRGSLTWDYQGEIQNGKPHGYGVRVWSNEDIWMGQFVNGTFTEGTLLTKLGGIKKGKWLSDGGFDGIDFNWVSDVMRGKLRNKKWVDATYYTTSCNPKREYGSGTHSKFRARKKIKTKRKSGQINCGMTVVDPLAKSDKWRLIEGKCVNGKVEGFGFAWRPHVWACADNQFYTGEFKDGYFHGVGRLKVAGTSVLGQWKKGRRHGWSVMSYGIGKLVSNAYWKNGTKTNMLRDAKAQQKEKGGSWGKKLFVIGLGAAAIGAAGGVTESSIEAFGAFSADVISDGQTGAWRAMQEETDRKLAATADERRAQQLANTRALRNPEGVGVAKYPKPGTTATLATAASGNQASGKPSDAQELAEFRRWKAQQAMERERRKNDMAMDKHQRPRRLERKSGNQPRDCGSGPSFTQAPKKGKVYWFCHGAQHFSDNHYAQAFVYSQVFMSDAGEHCGFRGMDMGRAFTTAYNSRRPSGFPSVLGTCTCHWNQTTITKYANDLRAYYECQPQGSKMHKVNFSY